MAAAGLLRRAPVAGAVGEKAGEHLWELEKLAVGLVEVEEGREGSSAAA